MNKLRVAFMGTPDFSIYSLEKLNEFHDVIAVLTQPDKRQNRGKKVAFSPVKEKALELDIPVYQPKNKKEIFDFIKNLELDLIVVVAYGKILPREVLEYPKYGCLNIHASLLPKLRGPSPINFAILNGDKKTGITIMQMNEGLDEGDILSFEEFNIPCDFTSSDLHDELKIIGGNLLIKAIKEIVNGNIKAETQNHIDATYTKKISRSMALIDFNQKNLVIDNFVRAMYSWPIAMTKYKGMVLKVHRGKAIKSSSEGKIGEIINVSKDGIEVKCLEGSYLIEEIQFPNKKKLLVKDYLLGNKIDENEVLG